MKKILLLSSITAVSCLCAVGCMVLEVDSLEVCEQPFPGLPLQYSYLIVPDTTVFDHGGGRGLSSADSVPPVFSSSPGDTKNAAQRFHRRLAPGMPRPIFKERSSAAMSTVLPEKPKARAALLRSGFPGRTCFFSLYEWLLLILIVLVCAAVIRIGLMKSREIVPPRR